MNKISNKLLLQVTAHKLECYVLISPITKTDLLCDAIKDENIGVRKV